MVVVVVAVGRGEVVVVVGGSPEPTGHSTYSKLRVLSWKTQMVAQSPYALPFAAAAHRSVQAGVGATLLAHTSDTLNAAHST